MSYCIFLTLVAFTVAATVDQDAVAVKPLDAVAQKSVAVVFSDIKLDDKSAIHALATIRKFKTVVVVINAIVDIEGAHRDLTDFLAKMQTEAKNPQTYVVVLAGASPSKGQASPHEVNFIKESTVDTIIEPAFTTNDMGPAMSAKFADLIDDEQMVHIFQISPTPPDFIWSLAECAADKIKFFLLVHGYNSKQFVEDADRALVQKVSLILASGDKLKKIACDKAAGKAQAESALDTAQTSAGSAEWAKEAGSAIDQATISLLEDCGRYRKQPRVQKLEVTESLSREWSGKLGVDESDITQAVLDAAQDTDRLDTQFTKRVETALQFVYVTQIKRNLNLPASDVVFTNNFGSFHPAGTGSSQPYSKIVGRLPSDHLENAVQDPFHARQLIKCVVELYKANYYAKDEAKGETAQPTLKLFPSDNLNEELDKIVREGLSADDLTAKLTDRFLSDLQR